MRRRSRVYRMVPEPDDPSLSRAIRRKLAEADRIEAQVAAARDAAGDAERWEVWHETGAEVERAARLRMSVVAKLRERAGLAPNHLEEVRWARRARRTALGMDG